MEIIQCLANLRVSPAIPVNLYHLHYGLVSYMENEFLTESHLQKRGIEHEQLYSIFVTTCRSLLLCEPF